MSKPVIVGWHAPPPGSSTGVADYAETLLAALCASAPASTVLERGLARADIHVYHLGNNRLHADVYARSLAVPGVVVIHDAVLNHFMLGALTQDRYIDEFVYNYGEWRRDLGRELWRERAACSSDPRYFQYAMLRRAVESARAVIVHNGGAAAIARDHGAENVRIIPHFFEQRGIPDAAETERFRARMAVEPDATLFGIFGYLRETKRLMSSISAFRRLNAVRPRTALLIAGKIVSGDLRRLLDNELPHPAIRRIDHLSDADFRIATAAVDCCLNLRDPPAGETSGIAIRLMGIGKPVILTEGPETVDIPGEACLRVARGADEAESLFAQMALVAEFPHIARQVGAEAAAHIRIHHSLETVAAQYWQVIESAGH